MNCSRYISELERAKKDGMLRSIPNFSAQGKWCTKDGQRLLNLSSNDYLGLFEREDLRSQFIEQFSGKLPHFSAASSRLLTGNCSSAVELEELLAQRFHKESALLYNSGYHANVGIISTLVSKESFIIADKRVHASVIDGIKLSGANYARFAHNDVDHLESIIKRQKDNYSQIFIITEGVFSMGGDRGRVEEIVKLKELYDNIVIYVDEAHSFGLCGESGLGVCFERGVMESVDIIVGTFGKAISSVGAFVALASAAREYLVNHSRPLIFSTALPPINIEWSRFIVEQLDSFSNERKMVTQNSELLRRELASLGYSTQSQSQIIALSMGKAAAAVTLSKELEKRGFYALPVRPPTVPANESGVRFSLSASMNESEIRELSSVIKELV